MARAKTLSDERYNARRRAKRELARIQRSLDRGGLKDSERATLNSYKNRLNQSIENSYIQRNITRGMSKIERSQLNNKADNALKQAKSVLESRSRGKNATTRTNEIFAQKMNLAAQNKRSGYSGMDEKSIQMFYIATRRLWQGGSLKDRNALIMRGLGVNSLEEAYRIVQRENRKKLKAYRNMLKGIKEEMTVTGWTQEAIDFYEDVPLTEEDTRITSPTDVIYF